jgi:hypothetical protein
VNANFIMYVLAKIITNKAKPLQLITQITLLILNRLRGEKIEGVENRQISALDFSAVVNSQRQATYLAAPLRSNAPGRACTCRLRR